MDDLLDDFIAETREMLEAVQGELVAWEAAPADREKLDAIFRFVHTVKGNCGFFDLPRLAALSHAGESALADVRAGNRKADVALIDGIFAIIDRIGDMIDMLEAGETIPDDSDADLIGSLQDSTCTNHVKTNIGADGDEIGKATAAPIARSIRLPVDLLDSVMAGISDIVLVRNELGRHIRDADLDPAVSSTFDRLTGIIETLREDISHMRMHRLDHLYGPLPRLVRDLATDLDKKVALEVEGGEVELDREIIELIRDPIVHILRNAIDHGIEPADERVAAGKPETGTIQIFTRQTGNRISIAIMDDGRGVDTGRLVAKAVEAGVATAQQCAAMAPAQLLELIFEPGLSTAEKVTSVSGRGVGMDVVRSNIERLGGTISATSEPGEGTRLFVSLPATLSIVPSLTVRVGEHRFGVPRSYVEEIVSSRSDHLGITRAGRTELVEYRGDKLRCCRLADSLGIEGVGTGESDLLIVKIASGDLFALAVDQVVSHEELVVKPLSDPIMASNLYTGASLLDDGSLVLMLHVAGLSEQEGLLGEIVKKKRVAVADMREAAEKKAVVPAVLFASLDGKERLVRMDSVARIAKADHEALRVGTDTAQVVIDGEIRPLAGFKGAMPESGTVNILILSDSEREIAYAIDRVIDTVAMDDKVMPDGHAGEVEGLVLLHGRATEVLDCHWLFAKNGTAMREDAAAICRIDLSDVWARSILRPLVEGAGYRVVDADSRESADIAIVLEGAGETEMHGGEIIHLSSEKGGDGVYRYDRDGLLEMLRLKKRVSA